MTALVRGPVHEITYSVFDHPENKGHEQIVFCEDQKAGLKALIAIHDTTLGPALGGTRMWHYETEAEALTDVLRLSAGMTQKNAVANLDLGGGKAVIIADSHKDKTPELFHAFARFVERLNGAYITAEDVGITQADMDLVAEVTDHVTGTSKKGLGNPSPFTAWGVFKGIEAAARHRLGASSVRGLTVAIQGVGHVGRLVARHLAEAGASLIVSDIRDSHVQRTIEATGARAVHSSEIHKVTADIFAPCALGGILNAQTVPELKAAVVAGAANNQLLEPDDGERLRKRGILYAPDYVINAGGVISLGDARYQGRSSEMFDRVEHIGHTLTAIFKRADDEGLSPAIIADRMAEERIAAVQG